MKPQRLQLREIAPDTMDDLAQVFCGDASAEGCWCMWFVIPVKQYHAAGSDGNRRAMQEMVEHSDQPVGLIAYLDDQPIGWIAVGPRSRYVRAIKTPTYRGRDQAEDEAVWLIPCHYVKSEFRGAGYTDELLKAAITLAKNNGAKAVEGFPYTGGKRQSRDTQVGFHSTFSKQGFEVIASPSDKRVVVRLDLSKVRL